MGIPVSINAVCKILYDNSRSHLRGSVAHPEELKIIRARIRAFLGSHYFLWAGLTKIENCRI